MISKNTPLVSIGIPAYNKPDQLERALKSLVGQTYKNIEIIISDDCSPNILVQAIAEKFMQSDPRIRYIKQIKNIGPRYNFRYVLDQARGKYFLWAADDDERSPECIEYYLENICDSKAIFSTYTIKDYIKNTEIIVSPPELSGKISKKDIHEFIHKPCPSIIYGLYETKLLKNIMPLRLFDFWDFYLPIRYMKNYGIKTIKSKPLYTAGIENGYRLNPFDKKFNYWDFIFNTLPLMATSSPHGFIRGVKFLSWIRYLNEVIKQDNGRIY